MELWLNSFATGWKNTARQRDSRWDRQPGTPCESEELRVVTLIFLMAARQGSTCDPWVTRSKCTRHELRYTQTPNLHHGTTCTFIFFFFFKITRFISKNCKSSNCSSFADSMKLPAALQESGTIQLVGKLPLYFTLQHGNQSPTSEKMAETFFFFFFGHVLGFWVTRTSNQRRLH